MATRKEYEMLFRLNAQVGSAYNSAFKSAQGTIASMQREIVALNKIQSDITAYQKQQAAIEQNQKRLELLKQQYANIKAELEATGEKSSDLQNKLLSKQMQIDRTSVSIEKQTERLETLRRSLSEAGVNTDNLREESRRLDAQINELTRTQEAAAEEAEKFGKAASAAITDLASALSAAGIIAGLKQVYEYFEGSARAAIDFESAMTGVAKTTDLTEDELAAMGAAIKTLSTEIPVTTSEIAGIAEVAGQLGIAKENLLDFATVMSMLSTATTMTADEGATMLAQFANITRMNPAYYSNLASAIVDLGNNYATTEQKIVEMAQGIAASASIAGMSEKDMLALSAAVTSLGIETQAGSTSMSRLISQMMTAVETGENLNKFASIANMSAAEFSELWGTNAVAALQAFISGLSETERNGMSATIALKELGITEARMQRMILSLANSGDLLNRTIDTANRAWNENTALVNEAEKRYATTQSRLTVLQNAYNNLKIAIGDNLTPIIKEATAEAENALVNITRFVEENPWVVKAVTSFVGIIGAATAGLSAYVAAVKIATIFTSAFSAAALPVVGAIMGGVAGIAALTAGITALNGVIGGTTEDVTKLTAVSRTQYYELADLRREYERVAAEMGETSAEAQLLKKRLDEATEAYNASRQKASELAATHKEVIRAHEELIATYEAMADEQDKHEASVLSLTARLEELITAEERTAESKQEILAIVELLNDQMPELGLAYDKYADSLNLSAEAIREVVRAQVEQERKQADFDKLKAMLSEEGALYDNMQAQLREVAAAEAEVARVRATFETRMKQFGGIQMYNYELSLAEQNLERAKAAAEEARHAYEDNQNQIDALTASIVSFEEATESAGNANDRLTGKIESVQGSLNILAAEYGKAYEEAYKSIEGQYDLWDKAEKIVPVSASKINSAIQSQTTYWQKYNENLSKLLDKSKDIDGLAEMVASFADGSAESVNAIAGMAQASDKRLAEMVQNWQKLKEQQATVSDSLAQLQTDFTAKLDVLQQEVEKTIEEMDLNVEAAEKGRRTIEGFIAGAEDMLPAVQRAYERIAEKAIEAIDNKLQIRSPSKVFMERGEYAMQGFLGGVANMQPELVATMSKAAAESVKSFSLVALAPQLMNALSAREPVAAESIGGTGGISVTVAPQYNISGAANAAEIEGIMRRNNEELRELIVDVLEDINTERARRAMR